MTTSLPHRRARLAAVTSAALAFAGLQLVAAPTAEAISAGLVIREVYGAGGNANAPYNADFVELYNRSASTVSLTGMGLQFRPTSGAVGANNVVALSGSVPANTSYLVQMNDAGAVGAALPAPDQNAVVPINLSSTNGQVLLLPTTTPFATAGDLAGDAGVIDMVGYGPGNATTANNSYETATTAVLSNTTSAARTAPFTDTDNNSTDFTVGAPTPENSGQLAAAYPGRQTGQVGVAITGFSLGATAGTGPYTWEATGLPPGVVVAANGAVSGTPTTDGVYTVTATVTDSTAPTSATDDVQFLFDIDPAVTPLVATDPGDKTGQVGVAITGFSLAATGGTGPYSWSATGLPPGVVVAANGAVSGTPTASGPFTVTATVTDSAGAPATDDVVFDFDVAPAVAPLVATDPGDKTGQVGVAITGFSLAATGGTGPYSWSATGLPPGVVVAANGAVSGTPTASGPFTVTATVTDSAGAPATDDVVFDFDVAPAAVPLAATDPGDKTGQVGVAITPFNLGATGGTGPYTWSATGLPGGVVVAANGTVSGTPTAAGTFTVTATVTDSTATTNQVQFSFQVSSPAPPPPAPPVDSTTKATVKPKHPEAGNKVTLKVVVKAGGAAVTGQVKVKVGKKTRTVTLKNGKATVSLGKLGKGTYKAKVTYLGSTTVEGSKDTVKFKVTK